MTIYLVRHAKAGERSVWEGDDQLRPLSGRGHLQARGLLDVLDGRAVRPAAVEPVRALHGDRRAARRASAASRSSRSTRSPKAPTLDEALALVRKHTAHGAVFCTHGDVIPMLLGALREARRRHRRRAAVAEGLDVGARDRRHRRGRRRPATSRRRPTDRAGRSRAAPARSRDRACGGSRPELRPLDSSSGPGTSRTTTVTIARVAESSVG